MAQIATDGSYSFGDVLGLFQGAAGIGLELLDGLPQVTSAFVPQVLSAGLIDYNGSAIKLAVNQKG
jgi:hypothetical protein